MCCPVFHLVSEELGKDHWQLPAIAFLKFTCSEDRTTGLSLQLRLQRESRGQIAAARIMAGRHLEGFSPSLTDY